VERILARANVYTDTFHRFFADRDSCFDEAFQLAVVLAAERVSVAYDPEMSGTDGHRSGLLDLLVFFDEHPQFARLCIVEAPKAGERTRARRREIQVTLAAAVDKLRTGRLRGPQSTTGERVVGAVFEVVHDHLIAEKPEPLTGLVNPLMSIIVLPYLGAEAANRELSRSAPPVRLRSPRAVDPADRAGIPATYRTLRVLAAIDAEPGICNRQVAAAAGIKDPGQASRLLARLERIGLIQNAGRARTAGQPNSWTLTVEGRRFHRSARTWARTWRLG
jgi:hypothetical protein